MTKSKVVEKNLKLSSDFNSYVTSHPDAMTKMPKSACIVFASKFDKELTKKNLKLAKNLNSEGKNCYIVKKTGKKNWTVEQFSKI